MMVLIRAGGEDRDFSPGPGAAASSRERSWPVLLTLMAAGRRVTLQINIAALRASSPRHRREAAGISGGNRDGGIDRDRAAGGIQIHGAADAARTRLRLAEGLSSPGWENQR